MSDSTLLPFSVYNASEINEPASGSSVRLTSHWLKWKTIIDPVKDQLKKWIERKFEVVTIKRGEELYHGTATQFPFADGATIPRGPAYFTPDACFSYRFINGDGVVAKYTLTRDVHLVDFGDEKESVMDYIKKIAKKVDEDASSEDLDGVLIHLGISGWLAIDEDEVYGDHWRTEEMMLVQPELSVKYQSYEEKNMLLEDEDSDGEGALDLLDQLSNNKRYFDRESTEEDVKIKRNREE